MKYHNVNINVKTGKRTRTEKNTSTDPLPVRIPDPKQVNLDPDKLAEILINKGIISSKEDLE